MNNRGAEIYIVELVIGVLVICFLTLMSFTATSAGERADFEGIGLTEKLNAQIEENVFFGSQTGLVTEETRTPGEIFDYARQNVVVNRRCKCNSPIICAQYEAFVFDTAKAEGVDPVLVSSLMMQESQCISDAFSGSSVGLMQINLIHCGNYGLPENREECRQELFENLDTNIRTGVAILKQNYNSYSDGVEFHGCAKNVTYYGWEAALRAYNGLGCGKDARGNKLTSQDSFVEEIMERYDILKKVGNFETKTETKGMLWWRKEVPLFSVEYFGKPGSVVA